MYIKGAGTAFADFSSKALFTAPRKMKSTNHLDLKFEVYMAVKSWIRWIQHCKVPMEPPESLWSGSDWAAATLPGAMMNQKWSLKGCIDRISFKVHSTGRWLIPHCC